VVAGLAGLVLGLAAVTSAAAGVVSGRVTFRGEPPALAPIPVLKDREVCGESLAPESLVVAPASRGVAHTVVALEGAPPAPAAGREVTLENRACRFVPHVLAAPLGAELLVVNADPVLHNLRAWLGERAVLNVVQPTQGQVSRRSLRRPGVMRLSCDTHVHMHGWLLVFDHPHFAVTDAAGEFRIAGVPAGSYRLTAWHEGWRVVRREPEGRLVYEPPHLLTREVTVPAAGEVRLELELTGRR
jgi:plastocyanin